MTRKPVVLYLSPVPDFKGGAERSLFDLLDNPHVTPVLGVPQHGPLSRAAEGKGIRVWVYDLGSVADIRRPVRLSDGIRYAREILRLVRKIKAFVVDNDIDIVHSNGLKAHALAVMSRWAGGRPAVVHLRDIAYTKVERLVWVLIGRMADRTILVSRPCWPGSTMPKSVSIVHNGFAERPPLPITPSDACRIGFIGRIHPAKGLHHLIDAAAELAREGYPVKVIVRGRFASETPRYEHEIRDKIAMAGLQDVVAFDGFFEDTGSLYAGVDIVCVPSFVPEPLSRVVVEAMGFALPVVAADSGGMPELITDGATGLLVDRPENLTAKLRLLVGDEPKRRSIGAAARDHSIRELSLEALHENVRKVYRTVLKKEPSDQYLS